MENLDKLVNELRKLPNELQWVEFKHNNYKPEMIGKDISALANSATLCEKQRAYMIWGVDDTTHEIVGTEFNLQSLKKGNQELENWLRSLLSSNADFEFHTIQMDNKQVGVLIIYRATTQTVMFEKVDYIRVGSYTKKLTDYPSLRVQLWDRLRESKFEDRLAKQDLELSDALRLLDYVSYFDGIGIPQPTETSEISHYLQEESIIKKQDNGLYSITNLGAILFGRKILEFRTVSRKALRVVQYSGTNRITLLKEKTFNAGYASNFKDAILYIEGILPSQEVIVGALRETKAVYPMLAIREAVANALIHQDFSITGTGPTIEIFDNRIEVTNAGTPLVDIMRIIDNPPRSRNEQLASLMRRLRMCEELGTGWDKIVISCELSQLPAPKIELYEDSTRVVLYGSIPFSELSTEDRVWACYLHACISYVDGKALTNSSLRDRFGLDSSASASISRVIKTTMGKDLIKPVDPDTAPKYMKYVPIWA
ncbi:MAG: transcriptional regulator [Clostridiales bacterium]|nr:transcriptional regulator [Clostridiales bacterium]